MENWRPTNSADDRDLPVLVADLKAHMRIEHDEMDRILLRAIEGAMQEAEEVLESPIVQREYTLTRSGFPDIRTFRLPNPPIASIVEITYQDTDDATQTLSSSAYSLVQDVPYPQVQLGIDETWPDTADRLDAVFVRYLAGYAANEEAVPPIVRSALLLRAATRVTTTEEAGIGIGAVAWAIPEQQGLPFYDMLFRLRTVGF